ncbi:hypothetical protein K505DRAFT_333095 [Melanomma pulvis-pyrius CBS 109.77]|uniref:Uncharacterized protein n=1 Tax=Melanomma pulvis-pyrius CBS 109.77 TaxID=1314802 RepID=A0A6A6XRN4_9PLEO|nr:hypothetical protein K505DRAFT_333095 [Melanomma pulvis-pyrius CBS 109.77]
MSVSITTSNLPSDGNTPLSPSAIPDLKLLPTPLASSALPVGQLASKSSKHNPTTLEDRDYDDIGTRWYKDVILVSTPTGRFTASLGGIHLVQRPGEGEEVGTIEAEQQRVRLLKDPSAALQKAVSASDAKQWLEEQTEGDVGFVVATREVTNASYKRARLVDVGNGNWEVVREIGAETKGGKRRPSGLEVQTGSKSDVVGVLVRKVIVEGGNVTLGAEIDAEFWN